MEGTYDIAIIGGGVAGLTAAILLSREGYSVAVFERKTYPQHRVCGEYISRESLPVLRELGLDPDQFNAPGIDSFRMTFPGGNTVSSDLPLGGIGISRYRLDYELAQLAFAAGVDFWENTLVRNVTFKKDYHFLETSQGYFQSKVCLGTYGKSAPLDKKTGRVVAGGKTDPGRHYIAVKYHIEATLPKNLIELHVFDNGYCGISAVEGNRFCLCYMTTAANLQKYGGVREMEKASLSVNPVLATYLEAFPSLYKAPLVISQINFSNRQSVYQHMLMCGDAAGLVAPLCGNGMSMAIHAAVLAVPLVDQFLKHRLSRTSMELHYERRWRSTFGRRVGIGRWMQKLLFNPQLGEAMLSLLKNKFLLQRMIRMTHGEPFNLPSSYRTGETGRCVS